MLADRIIQKYLNKKVSLLSTSDVRYVGQLYTVDPEEPSIALRYVQCLGTEGRRSGRQAIGASKYTYEFIRFRANNINSLNLDELNEKKDLNKEILEPLRQQAESINTQPSQQSQQQPTQQTSNKNGNNQRNKPNVSHEEPKRKVGGYHAPPNRSPPYDYYSLPFSPQYDANNPYDYGNMDVYPPLPPSQHQQQASHDIMYSPPYQYENEVPANYSQNPTYSQVTSRARPPQPQSSYHRRESNDVHAPVVGGDASSGGPNVANAIPPNNEYYYQQHPSSPGYGAYVSNVPFTNQPSRGRGGYNAPNYRDYRQYPRNYDRNVDNRNNDFFYQPQSNLNRPPYQQTQYNDRRPGQGQQNRGNYGKTQSGGNQPRYYNQRQRQPNQNRYNNVVINENQAPGTGAYLDRRIRGDDLDLAAIANDFDFGTSGLETQKEEEKNKTTETGATTTSVDGPNANASTDANASAGGSGTSGTGATSTTTEETKKETKTKGENIDETDKEHKANEEEKQKELNEQREQSREEKTSSTNVPHKPAYDKNKSFFDNITTDADIKQQQKQVNLDEQRQHDVETFGNVASAYRSRHTMNERNVNYRRNDRSFNQRRNNFYGSQQQGFDNNRRYNNPNRRPPQPMFDNNVNNPQRWVKRPNY